MENLLNNDFKNHYRLTSEPILTISYVTNASYFELKDDNVVIYETVNSGFAKYTNTNSIKVNIVNYEAFIKSLSHKFKEGRKVCDLIVYDDEKQHFLLNELTDTQLKYVHPFPKPKSTTGEQKPGKLAQATVQLLSTLIDLSAVVTIANFINNFQIKRCCFFNKQSHSPTPINATSAFGRINNLAPNGFKMENKEIESYGFELYEYSGNQIYRL